MKGCVQRLVVLVCMVVWSSRPALARDPTRRLEDIRLGSVTSLSIGGQLRLRSEYQRNPELGLAGVRTQDVQLLRGLAHAELRSRGGSRTFLELGTALAVGSELPVRPIDQDPFSVRQAFWEGELVRARLRARVGRQEISLGSGRLVALRDGPNVRRSFDGLRLTLLHARGEVEGIAAAEVDVEPGVLDDFSNPAELLWGVYSTTRVAREQRLSIDGYYLGLRREGASFGERRGLELRHSLGARLFGTLGSYDYNTELIGQAGTFAGASITAWTVAIDQGLTKRGRGATARLGLRTNVTSGGASDPRRLHTFDALYPNLAYFSQLTILSPANHADVHPRLTVAVLERLQLELGGDWFWRSSQRDTIYQPPGVPVGMLADYEGRFVGTELTASAELSLGRHATLTAYYTRFWAGTVVRSIGGTNVDFLAFWLSMVF